MHLDMIAINAINKEISRLEKGYLECEKCPPERFCCANLHNFIFDMEYDIANTLFEPHQLENMINSGQIIDAGENYKLQKGRCPLLSEDNLCKVHYQKEELRLKACFLFPFFFVQEVYRDGKPPLEGPMIVVDDRCAGVRRNWDHVSRELNNIADRYNIDVWTKSEIYRR